MLIQFGSLDLRQQLTALHPCADIRVPPLDITVGARIDGGLDIGLDTGRKGDVELRSARLRMGHADGRARLFVGIGGKVRAHRPLVKKSQQQGYGKKIAATTTTTAMLLPAFDQCSGDSESAAPAR